MNDMGQIDAFQNGRIFVPLVSPRDRKQLCQATVYASSNEVTAATDSTRVSNVTDVEMPMRLLDLSDDILVHVLSQQTLSLADVVAFSQVSVRARAIALNPLLWRDIVVPPLRRGAPLVLKNVRSYSEDSHESDTSVGIWCGRTRKRSRRRARGDECSAAVAIERISRFAGDELVSLDISSLVPCELRSGHLSELSVLANRCRSLEAFSCPPTDALSPDCLRVFVSNCPSLRNLALCSVSRLTLPALTIVLKAHPKISRLSVIDCMNVRGSGKAIWAAIECIREELISLNMTGTPVSSLPLREMGALCCNLQELHVDRCLNLNFQQSFHKISASPHFFPSLELIRGDFTNGSAHVFLRNLFEKQGTAALLALSFNARSRNLNLSFFIRALPPIEHLALAGQEMNDKCFLDIILTRLCGTLRTLDVSKSSSLTGTVLSDAHRLPRLEQMDLSGTRFTEPALRILVLHVAPRLTVLKVAACRSISNRNLRRAPLKVIRGQPGLQ
jgi:hypothetical protein